MLPTFIDFGFARKADLDSLMSTMCGSFAYSAPELISGISDYSGFATDCWSLGVILFCVVCRRLPYDRDDLMALVRGEEKKVLEFPDEISKGI